LSTVIIPQQSTINKEGQIMTQRKADLMQGTLNLLVLKTLDLGPLHGWAITKRIQQMSEGVLEVGQGSLYPALYRLRDQGLIKSRWEISGSEQRVKVYELTRAGREALAREQEGFRLFVGAVERVLDTN
jgi:transcriptional regulator